jgi:putative ABC transport system permease protein
VTFALFGVLQGLKTGVDEAIARTRADVLFVAPSALGGAPLPRASIARLDSIPGVTNVTFADGLLTTYQTSTQSVYVLAIDPGPIWLTLDPERFKVLRRDLEELKNTRTGALISTGIANKYGWHVGDQIPLTSTILQNNGSATWTFNIVGTFVAHGLGGDAYIVANYAYLDEARQANKGKVRNFYVVVSDPQQAQTVADTIDRTFANSSSETRTASLRENAQQQLSAIGDLSFVIRCIVGAVLVALLFSVSTMMMQTIRERTPELAVLKTVGFTDRAVFSLVVTEAMLVCTAGALLGLALALGVFPIAAKFVPGLSMPAAVIATGAFGAVLVASISVALPAFRAARLQVVDALGAR